MGPNTSPPTSNPGRPPRASLRLLAGATAALALVSCGVLVAAWLPDALSHGFLQDKHLFAGGLCVVLLGLQGLTLRSMLKRSRTLEHVGGALSAWSHGEPDLHTMRITATPDAISQQWNRLIDELEEARQATRDAEALQELTLSATGSQDHSDTFDALPHGVVLINPDATIAAANGAASRVLMRSRDRLVGAPMDKVLPKAQPLMERVQLVLDQTDSRGGSVEIEVAADEEETTIMRATIRPVGKPGQLRSALVFFEDVTQQRTADQSRNLFVAQATHELRTPLTNIGLYLERAIDLDDDETADRAECLNVINQEVLRLGRVVEEVLSVSEIEAGSLKVRHDDVRVDQIMQSLEHEYQPQAREKDIDLLFDLPPKLSVVQGDREKITLALHNLLGNAIKYTPAEGKVRVQLLEVDNDITVSVTDTGIGINEDELSKVFEKFYRAQDDRLQGIGGSGLGLALARDVIRLHGGDITVESELNKGSTFTLRLPINAAVSST
ncbi:PAS domain-containing sensor histidine kinase [Algisphaera agarilytica]|uniref:histidine kinase n=1 Tax=Algisphaera agarilytica TaxID=1385975 RepID=A0A7X0H4Q3_9BACT|nr:ATP-binding protein [Algisphaera agarilytica]MBB6429248.1 signal transduction histidine kinase [Algisphaera agarilytica]